MSIVIFNKRSFLLLSVFNIENRSPFFSVFLRIFDEFEFQPAKCQIPSFCRADFHTVFTHIACFL